MIVGFYFMLTGNHRLSMACCQGVVSKKEGRCR